MKLEILRQQSFPFVVACDVLGVKLNTFRAWIKRGQIQFSDEEIERGFRTGDPHRITFTTVVRLAIMIKLTKFGMVPETAWNAAFYFTSRGGAITSDQVTTRLPGELFKKGMTWLFVDENGNGNVVNLTSKPSAYLDLGVAAANGAIILHMNPFIEEICNKLSNVAELSAA